MKLPATCYVVMAWLTKQPANSANNTEITFVSCTFGFLAYMLKVAGFQVWLIRDLPLCALDAELTLGITKTIKPRGSGKRGVLGLLLFLVCLCN